MGTMNVKVFQEGNYLVTCLKGTWENTNNKGPWKDTLY